MILGRISQVLPFITREILEPTSAFLPFEEFNQEIRISYRNFWPEPLHLHPIFRRFLWRCLRTHRAHHGIS